MPLLVHFPSPFGIDLHLKYNDMQLVMLRSRASVDKNLLHNSEDCQRVCDVDNFLYQILPNKPKTEDISIHNSITLFTRKYLE